MRTLGRLLVLLVSLAPSAHSGERILGVPLRWQTGSNLCWAADSEAILKYFGKDDIDQCYLANFAFGSN